MRLASLRDGSRDGRLVVVSRDLTFCSDARHIAPTLQAALDDWARIAPHLELIARGVESGGQPVMRFHEREARAPLPRAFGFATVAPGEPHLTRRASDGFLDPRAPIVISDDTPLTPAAGIAVVTGDLGAGADAAAALAAIRLMLLVGTLGARTTFSPVAVTPDELGAAWAAGRPGGLFMTDRNGRPQDRLDPAGVAFDLGALAARAARDRPLAAGSLLAVLPLQTAEPAPLGIGDTLRVEMRDAEGHSLFGAIEQVVEAARLTLPDAEPALP